MLEPLVIGGRQVNPIAPGPVVYGLHNGNGVYRYVGSSIQARRRLNFHRTIGSKKKISNLELDKWLKSNKVYMDVLERTKPDNMIEREEYWTIYLLSLGFQLFNKAIGRKNPSGEQSYQYGRRHTQEWRMNASKLKSGEGNSRALLSNKDASDIRRLFASGTSRYSLSEAYGVDYTVIQRIISGKTYRD